MPASDRALMLTRIAAAAASDRLAQDIVALDVSEHLVITDTFVICSAPSDRQVRAIVDAVEERMREQADTRPVRREGDREARWVLLDYVDIVVHVQHTEEREFYSLERLWKDCPAVPLDDVTGQHTDASRVPVGVGAARDAGLVGDGPSGGGPSGDGSFDDETADGGLSRDGVSGDDLAPDPA